MADQQSNTQIRPQTASERILTKESVRSPQLNANPVNKDQTHPYFKESKVGACTYVKLEGGCPKAVPFYSKPVQTYAETMEKLGVKESLSQQQFKQQPVVFATSPKKPLCRYDPNSQRNILQQDPFKRQRPNTSQIVFGTEKPCYKKSNTYGAHASVGLCSNPHILAFKTQRLQQQLQK